MMMLILTVLVLVMMILTMLTQVYVEMAPVMLLEVQGVPVVAPMQEPMAPGAPVVVPMVAPVPEPGAPMHEGLVDRPTFVIFQVQHKERILGKLMKAAILLILMKAIEAVQLLLGIPRGLLCCLPRIVTKPPGQL